MTAGTSSCLTVRSTTSRSSARSCARKGLTFRTGTDTEVLLKLYQAEGARCLERVNGIFAFAIHDTLEGTLFLARDRFGEKPLYTLKDRRGFVFASELKALRPFVRRMAMTWELNTDRLFEYMAFRYVSREDTLIRNVAKRALGSWTRDGRVKEGETLRRFTIFSGRSIRLRMISDTAIGVARELPRGHTLRAADLIWVRPGGGIRPAMGISSSGERSAATSVQEN